MRICKTRWSLKLSGCSGEKSSFPILIPFCSVHPCSLSLGNTLYIHLLEVTSHFLQCACLDMGNITYVPSVFVTQFVQLQRKAATSEALRPRAQGYSWSGSWDPRSSGSAVAVHLCSGDREDTVFLKEDSCLQKQGSNSNDFIKTTGLEGIRQL